MTETQEPQEEDRPIIVAETIPECEVGTKRHSDHDERIAELRQVVNLMHVAPRTLVTMIIELRKENSALSAKLAHVRERIEKHLATHNKKA